MRRLVLWVCLSLALLAGCSSPRVLPADFYRLGPGPNDLTLLVSGDSPDARAVVTVIEQSDLAVRVRVVIEDADDQADDWQGGVGTTYEVTVTLNAPLGARTVTNEDGTAVPPAPVFTP